MLGPPVRWFGPEPVRIQDPLAAKVLLFSKDLLDEQFISLVQALASSSCPEKRWLARFLVDIESVHVSALIARSHNHSQPVHVSPPPARAVRCYHDAINALAWHLPPWEAAPYLLARSVSTPLPVRRAAINALTCAVLQWRASAAGPAIAHAIVARLLLDTSLDDPNVWLDLNAALGAFTQAMLDESIWERRHFVDLVQRWAKDRRAASTRYLTSSDQSHALMLLRNAHLVRFRPTKAPRPDASKSRSVSGTLTLLAQRILFGDGPRSWLAAYTAAYYLVDRYRMESLAERNVRSLDDLWPQVPPDRQRAAVCGALVAWLDTAFVVSERLKEALQRLSVVTTHLRTVFRGADLKEAAKELAWWERLLEKSWHRHYG